MIAFPESYTTPSDGSIRFVVRGTPAPQGSKRAFVVNGRAVLTESSAKVKPWREDVRAAAVDALEGRPPLRGPVSVTIEFTLARPKSAPRSRVLPDVRPDIDKLSRSSLDALTSAGVFVDDSQVCELHVVKVYGVVPGAAFTIARLVPESGQAVAA